MPVERTVAGVTFELRCSLCGLYCDDDAAEIATNYGDGLGALDRRAAVCGPCLTALDARPRTHHAR